MRTWYKRGNDCARDLQSQMSATLPNQTVSFTVYVICSVQTEILKQRCFHSVLQISFLLLIQVLKLRVHTYQAFIYLTLKKDKDVYISVYNVQNVYTEHGTITLNNLYLTHQIGPSYNISDPDMMFIDFTDMSQVLIGTNSQGISLKTFTKC